jgi:hypothetical protein
LKQDALNDDHGKIKSNQFLRPVTTKSLLLPRFLLISCPLLVAASLRRRAKQIARNRMSRNSLKRAGLFFARFQTSKDVGRLRRRD